MSSTTRLKLAAVLLFWFGVVAEFFIISDIPVQYYENGAIGGISLELQLSTWITILNLVYNESIHVTHILAGYWLSKGTRKGTMLGISVGIYETIFWVSWNRGSNLLDPLGITIRIIFIIIIFLIIWGRSDLAQLHSENWRPWKKPF